MVIYSEEAVERKRHERGTLDNHGLARSRDGGGATPASPEAYDLSRPSWRDCSRFSGATVWDRRLIRPLATPVLGGMLSSLATRADRHTHHFHVAAMSGPAPLAVGSCSFATTARPTNISNLTLRRNSHETFICDRVDVHFAVAGCSGDKVNLSALKPAASKSGRKRHHRPAE